MSYWGLKIKTISNLAMIWLLVLLSNNIHGAVTNGNVELRGKFSINQKRHLLHVGALAPLYYNQQNLVHLTTFFMQDTLKSNEFNVCLGFRHQLNEQYIHGIYAFYDYRHHHHYRQKYQQLTIGYEFFTTDYELRANLYLPEKKKLQLSSTLYDKNVTSNFNGYNTTFTIDRVANITNIEPSRGFDLEAGITTNNIDMFITYYSFFDIKNTTHGIRGRVNYHLFTWLTLEGEINYDQKRQLLPYAGIKLSLLKFDTVNNKLTNKMFSLPVRDIDIIVDEEKINNVNIQVTKEYSGWVPMVEEGVTGSNIFPNMAALNAYLDSNPQSRYADIGTIMENKIFTVISNFGNSNLLAKTTTNEFDILTNIRYLRNNGRFAIATNGNRIFKDATTDGPINLILETGFWSNENEMNFFVNELNRLRNGTAEIITANEILNAFNNGTFISSNYYGLLYQMRNRPDVYVGYNDALSDQDKSLEDNIKGMGNAIKNHTGQRFIIMNWLQGINSDKVNHTTGLIVDTIAEKITYMESNDIRLNKLQRDTLNNFWPQYQIEDFTPCKQQQDWSCGPHTFANIIGYLNGSSVNNGYQWDRNVKTIYQVMELSAREYYRL